MLKLQAAGWEVEPYSINEQPLGVVEAHKVTLGRQNVLTQAQRYARDGQPLTA
jgi:type I site-specific restriction endonuclease